MSNNGNICKLACKQKSNKMAIEQGIQQSQESNRADECKQIFGNIIQPTQYVGDIYSINYETAKVIIHDTYKNKVGGIPSLSFLIATRVDPKSNDIDFKDEDSSFILLRVMDSTPLPQDKEAERIRTETAQRISGKIDTNWDDTGVMDARTKNYLGYNGIQCRIIGTFYLEEDADNI